MNVKHKTEHPMNVAQVNILCLLLFLSGCAPGAPQWQESPTTRRQTLERDPMSYGAVTSKVQKGVTTQEDIIRNFGAPNITTTSTDGSEVWVYDKISTESRQEGWSEAARFDSFFTLGITGVNGGQSSQKFGGSHSSTVRTLTVIINFNKEKKVKDYSARATQF